MAEQQTVKKPDHVYLTVEPRGGNVVQSGDGSIDNPALDFDNDHNRNKIHFQWKRFIDAVVKRESAPGGPMQSHLESMVELLKQGLDKPQFISEVTAWTKEELLQDFRQMWGKNGRAAEWNLPEGIAKLPYYHSSTTRRQVRERSEPYGISLVLERNTNYLLCSQRDYVEGNPVRTLGFTLQAYYTQWTLQSENVKARLRALLEEDPLDEIKLNPTLNRQYLQSVCDVHVERCAAALNQFMLPVAAELQRRVNYTNINDKICSYLIKKTSPHFEAGLDLALVHTAQPLDSEEVVRMKKGKYVSFEKSLDFWSMKHLWRELVTEGHVSEYFVRDYDVGQLREFMEAADKKLIERARAYLVEIKRLSTERLETLVSTPGVTKFDAEASRLEASLPTSPYRGPMGNRRFHTDMSTVNANLDIESPVLSRMMRTLKDTPQDSPVRQQVEDDVRRKMFTVVQLKGRKRELMYIRARDQLLDDPKKQAKMAAAGAATESDEEVDEDFLAKDGDKPDEDDDEDEEDTTVSRAEVRDLGWQESFRRNNARQAPEDSVLGVLDTQQEHVIQAFEMFEQRFGQMLHGYLRENARRQAEVGVEDVPDRNIPRLYFTPYKTKAELIQEAAEACHSRLMNIMYQVVQTRPLHGSKAQEEGHQIMLVARDVFNFGIELMESCEHDLIARAAPIDRYNVYDPSTGERADARSMPRFARPNWTKGANMDYIQAQCLVMMARFCLLSSQEFVQLYNLESLMVRETHEDDLSKAVRNRHVLLKIVNDIMAFHVSKCTEFKAAGKLVWHKPQPLLLPDVSRDEGTLFYPQSVWSTYTIMCSNYSRKGVLQKDVKHPLVRWVEGQKPWYDNPREQNAFEPLINACGAYIVGHWNLMKRARFGYQVAGSAALVLLNTYSKWRSFLQTRNVVIRFPSGYMQGDTNPEGTEVQLSTTYQLIENTGIELPMLRPATTGDTYTSKQLVLAWTSRIILATFTLSSLSRTYPPALRSCPPVPLWRTVILSAAQWLAGKSEWHRVPLCYKQLAATLTYKGPPAEINRYMQRLVSQTDDDTLRVYIGSLEDAMHAYDFDDDISREWVRKCMEKKASEIEPPVPVERIQRLLDAHADLDLMQDLRFTRDIIRRYGTPDEVKWLKHRDSLKRDGTTEHSLMVTLRRLYVWIKDQEAFDDVKFMWTQRALGPLESGSSSSSPIHESPRSEAFRKNTKADQEAMRVTGAQQFLYTVLQSFEIEMMETLTYAEQFNLVPSRDWTDVPQYEKYLSAYAKDVQSVDQTGAHALDALFTLFILEGYNARHHALNRSSKASEAHAWVLEYSNSRFLTNMTNLVEKSEVLQERMKTREVRVKRKKTTKHMMDMLMRNIQRETEVKIQRRAFKSNVVPEDDDEEDEEVERDPLLEPVELVSKEDQKRAEQEALKLLEESAANQQRLKQQQQQQQQQQQTESSSSEDEDDEEEHEKQDSSSGSESESESESDDKGSSLDSEDFAPLGDDGSSLGSSDFEPLPFSPAWPSSNPTQMLDGSAPATPVTPFQLVPPAIPIMSPDYQYSSAPTQLLSNVPPTPATGTSNLRYVPNTPLGARPVVQPFRAGVATVAPAGARLPEMLAAIGSLAGADERRKQLEMMSQYVLVGRHSGHQLLALQHV